MTNLETPARMPSLSMAIPEGDAGTQVTFEKKLQLFGQGMKDCLVGETAMRLVHDARVAQLDS